MCTMVAWPYWCGSAALSWCQRLFTNQSMKRRMCWSRGRNQSSKETQCSSNTLITTFFWCKTSTKREFQSYPVCLNHFSSESALAEVVNLTSNTDNPGLTLSISAAGAGQGELLVTCLKAMCRLLLNDSKAVQLSSIRSRNQQCCNKQHHQHSCFLPPAPSLATHMIMFMTNQEMSPQGGLAWSWHEFQQSYLILQS